MWTDLSSLGQRKHAHAPIPTGTEPLTFEVHSLRVEQWFCKVWSPDQQYHLGTLGMKFSGPAPDLLNQKPWGWGSLGESDKPSRLGITAVEFMVKSSGREARQRPKECGKERSLFKRKTLVLTQSE